MTKLGEVINTLQNIKTRGTILTAPHCIKTSYLCMIPFRCTRWIGPWTWWWRWSRRCWWRTARSSTCWSNQKGKSKCERYEIVKLNFACEFCYHPVYLFFCGQLVFLVLCNLNLKNNLLYLLSKDNKNGQG